MGDFSPQAPPPKKMPLAYGVGSNCSPKLGEELADASHYLLFADASHRGFYAVEMGFVGGDGGDAVG